MAAEGSQLPISLGITLGSGELPPLMVCPPESGRSQMTDEETQAGPPLLHLGKLRRAITLLRAL